MIDILIPVLGRPDQAQTVVDSIQAKTSVPYRILFLTSPGDNTQFTACARTGADVLEVDAPRGHGQYATKINEGFRRTRAPFVLCGADDIKFTTGWDRDALAVARVTEAGVVGTNDMANRMVMKGLFSTHPLIRRDYITQLGGSLDGPGIVYHEGYDHNYPDRELACLAQHRNMWAFAIASHVIHRHPGWNNPKADATYKKGARKFRQDHLLFMRRAVQWDGVGLTPREAEWLAKHRPRNGTRR